MRLVLRAISLVAVFLVACSAGPRGPAWPKQTDPEVDGGESLEPRTASATAVEQSEDEPADEPEADAEDAAEASDTEDEPSAETAETSDEPASDEDEGGDDDELTTEELVIEIEEDE